MSTVPNPHLIFYLPTPSFQMFGPKTWISFLSPVFLSTFTWYCQQISLGLPLDYSPLPLPSRWPTISPSLLHLPFYSSPWLCPSPQEALPNLIGSVVLLKLKSYLATSLFKALQWLPVLLRVKATLLTVTTPPAPAISCHSPLLSLLSSLTGFLVPPPHLHAPATWP